MPSSNTLGAQKAAIESAMKQYLQEKAVAPSEINIKFSNDIGELDGSAVMKENLGGLKGFIVDMAHQEDPSRYGKISEIVFGFTHHDPLIGCRTYKSQRMCIGAWTWEDVAYGMNQQFKRLDSQAYVDMSVFRIIH